MKSKSIYTWIVAGVFALVGVLGFFSLQSNKTDVFAEGESEQSSVGVNSTERGTVDVWDGTYSLSGVSAEMIYDGSAVNKDYHIYTATDFAYFCAMVNGGLDSGYADYSGKKIYLETDIDLNGNEWTPIGSNLAFYGEFYGQGHYIYNLKVSSNTSSSYGLFGYVGASAIIDNVHLRNVDINCSKSSDNLYVGGLVGCFQGDMISNCSVYGKIAFSTSTTSGEPSIGGLVGKFEGSKLEKSKTFVDMNVSGGGDCRVGGVAGYVNHESVQLDQLSSRSNITLNSKVNCVGGIVGYFDASKDSKLSNSYNVGAISGSTNVSEIYIGGLVGYAITTNSDSTLSIDHVYNAGELSEDGKTGGLIGHQNANLNISQAMNLTEMSKGWLFGEESSDKSCKKKQVYYTYTPTFVYGDHLTESGSVTKTAQIYKNSDFEVANLSTHARQKSFYQNENFWDVYKESVTNDNVCGSTIWGLSSSINDSLPYLLNVQNVGLANADTNISGGSKPLGVGSFEKPYAIETAGDLVWMSWLDYSNPDYSGKYFALQNDIDLSGKIFLSINGFSGVFDGNGFKISGLTFPLDGTTSTSLFSSTSDAVIKNLKVENVRYLSGTGTASLIDSSSNTYIYNVEGDKTIAITNNLTNDNVATINTNGGIIYKRTFDGSGYSDSVIRGELRYTTEKVASLDQSSICATLKTTSGISASGEANTFEYYVVKTGYLAKKISNTEVSWEAKTISVTLQYNKYEMVMYKEAGDNSPTEDKSVTKDIPYDSVLGLYCSDWFMDCDRDGGKYYVCGLYKDFGAASSYGKCFTNPLTCDTFVNDNFVDKTNDTTKTIYAKWMAVGDLADDQSFTFTVVIQKASGESGKFDNLAGKIESVTLTSSDTTTKFEYKPTDEDANAESLTCTFKIFTSSYSLSRDNYWTLNVALTEDGTKNLASTVSFEKGKFDEYYGGLLLDCYGSNFQGLNEVSLKELAITHILNLKNDEKVNIVLKKKEYEMNINISDNVYFAVAPQMISDYKSNAGETESSSNPSYTYQYYVATIGKGLGSGNQHVLMGDKTDKTKLNIGLDVRNKTFVDYQVGSGNATFVELRSGSLDLLSDFGTQGFVNDGECVILEVIYNNISEYFQYYCEITNSNTYYYFASAKMDENENIVTDKLIAKWTLSKSGEDWGGTLSYYAYSQFQVICAVSAEDADSDNIIGEKNVCENLFSKYYGVSEETYKKVDAENTVGYFKLGYNIDDISFQNVIKEKDVVEYVKDNFELKAITGYTSIVFNYKMIVEDENGALTLNGNKYKIITDYAPTISDASNVLGKFSVVAEGTTGTLDWNVTSSLMYQFADSAFVFETNVFVRDADGNEVTGPFSVDNDGPKYSSSLDNGSYDVYFLCVKTEYKVSGDVIFIQRTNKSTSVDLLDESNRVDLIKSGAQNLPTITINGTLTSKDSGNTYNYGYYDSTLSATTTMEGNQAFVFNGWYVVGCDENGDEEGKYLSSFGIYLANNSEWENIDLGDFYYLKADENTRKVVVSPEFKIYAVYILKEVTFDFERSGATLTTTNDSSLYVYKSSKVYQFSLTANSDAKYIAGYTLKNGTSEIATISFDWNVKDGNSYRASYGTGSSVITNFGTFVGFEDGNKLAEKFIINYIDEYLEKTSGLGENTTLTICPIVKNKKLNITFTSGGDKTEVLGDVFDNNGNNTTASSFEQTSEIDGIVTFEDDNKNSYDNIFNKRTGYKKASISWNWSWKTSSGETSTPGNNLYLNGNKWTVTSIPFANSKDDELLIEIEVYVVWEAETYGISLKQDDVSARGTTYVTVTYDSGLNGKITAPQKTGYTFGGWMTTESGYVETTDENGKKIQTEAPCVIDENGNLIAGVAGYTNDKAYWIHANAVTLYAKWTANSYNITVNLNNSVEESSVAITTSIVYDQAFSTMTISDEEFEKLGVTKTGEFDIFTYLTKTLSRVGFTNKGLLTEKGRKITSDMTFKISMGEINLDEPSALNLYVKWEFDKTAFALSFTNPEVKTTYNGKEQTFGLGNFASGEGSYEATGFVINGNFTISLGDRVDISLAVKLSTESTAVLNQDDVTMKVTNTGTYEFSLQLTITDNAKYRCEDLTCEPINLTITVSPAELNWKFNDSTKESMWVNNICSLAEHFVSGNLTGCESISALVGELGEEITVTNDNKESVYNYLLVKYYNIATNYNNVEYKSWTYSNFSAENYTKLIAQMQFFDFYDLSEKSSTKTLDLGKYLVVSNESINETVGITRVEIVSNGTFTAQNEYELRAILNKSSASNFVVEEDANKNLYIVIGKLYIMPQFVKLSIGTKLSAFYNENIHTVDWKSGDSYGNGGEYYLASNGIYVSATITTSNSGSEENDTKFTFVDGVNYLKLSNVDVITENGLRVNKSVVIYIAPSDFYTILQVNFKRIYLSAQYLTKTDETYTTSRLGEDVVSNLFSLSVTYTAGGENEYTETDVIYNEWKTVTSEDETYDIRLYRIEADGTNGFVIYISDYVKSVQVKISETQLADYLALKNWYLGKNEIKYQSFSIDGAMSTEDEYTITNSKLVTTPINKIETAYCYAIYTDLTCVKYKTGFETGEHKDEYTTFVMKLKSSTKDDFDKHLPSQNGFVLDKTTVQENGKEYSSLFDENGVFDGVAGSRFSITLKFSWSIGKIAYEQTKKAISIEPNNTAQKISPSDIVSIASSQFAFTYKWKLLDDNNEAKAVGTNGTLTEDEKKISGVLTVDKSGNLIVKECGKYTLTVTAVLSEADAKKYSITLTTGKEQSFTVDFEVLKLKIASVKFENMESVIYSGSDHSSGLYATVGIYYASADGGYSASTKTKEFYYTANKESKNLAEKFYITKNEESFVQIVDAGTYNFELTFDENYYIIENDVVTTTTFVVQEKEIDLSKYTKSFEKVFNSNDTEMKGSILVGNMTVGLFYTRESGEDVGTYDLYLKDSETYKSNYKFTSGDIVLFTGGELQTLGNETSIGTFTIKPSGTLKISYNITSDFPATIKKEYDGKNYSVNVNSDLQMKIQSGSDVYKTIELVLYDDNSKKTIGQSKNDASDSEKEQTKEVLALIKSVFGNLSMRFADRSQGYANGVCDVGTYNYSFANTAISKYYQNVVFSDGYQFEIIKQNINFSTEKLDKVYDGENVSYFKTDGTLIGNSLGEYTGAYVRAEYSSSHAGEVSVTLTLAKNVDEVDIENYQLASTTVDATISKLAVSLQIELTKTSYVYGEVTSGDYEQLVKATTLNSGSGTSVNNLLGSGYYEYVYDVTMTNGSEVQTNGSRRLYVGNYTFSAKNSTFSDFDVTFHDKTFEITPYNYSLYVTNATFTNLATEAVAEELKYSMTVDSTGDSLDILFKAVDGEENDVCGKTVGAGNYKLVLLQTKYADGNVNVSLSNEDNTGLVVIASTNLLYISIDGLSVDYDGQTHTLALNSDNALCLDNTPLTISYTNDKNERVDDADVVFTFAGLTQTNAGSYNFSMQITSDVYTNIVLKSKTFTINKKSVDASQFTTNLTKEYDGKSTLTFDTFSEKIGNDDVLVVAKFSNSTVGSDKTVELSLQGTASGNYVLSSKTCTGTITKASAIVTLKKTKYIYGEISEGRTLAYSVMANNVEIGSGQYKLMLAITSGQYSGAKYLKVGTYGISMTATSTNYELALADNSTEIKVSPYALTINFTTSGLIEVSYASEESKSQTFAYTYTTAFGENIALTLGRDMVDGVLPVSAGYYRVTSCAISGESDYTISSFTDLSVSGAFKIKAEDKMIYLLASSEDSLTTISSTLNMTYDGKSYTSASLVANGNSFKLSIFTEENEEHSWTLNAYLLDGGVYKKQTITFENFESNLTLSGAVRDVANQRTITSDYILASNYSAITFGTTNQMIVSVGKKDVYFVSDNITKKFDYKEAIISLDSTALEGICDGDNVSVTVTLKNSSGIAIHRAVGLSVTAELIGDSENYTLHCTKSNGDKVSGEITPAEITVTIPSITVEYGKLKLESENDDFSQIVSYESDVEVPDSGIGLSLKIKSPQSSTSGYLKVGTYLFETSLNTSDFTVTFVYSGTTANDEEEVKCATIVVEQRNLAVTAESGSLLDIFSKKYDGTTDIEDEKKSNLGLSGILSVSSDTGEISDDVSIKDAKFASSEIGNGIHVVFELDGVDKDNYLLQEWESGVISGYYVELAYVLQNEEALAIAGGYSELKNLLYPFKSKNTLTANSTTTKIAFPSNVTGKDGYTFGYWSLDLSGLSEDNFGTIVTYAGSLCKEKDKMLGKVKIAISNNSESVAFLDKLLKDENLGFYYKNPSAENHNSQSTADVTIKLNANWTKNSYEFKVVVNETYVASMKIKVNGTEQSGEDGKLLTSVTVDYDTSIVVELTMKDGCSITGTDDESRGGSIIQSSKTLTYTLSKISQKTTLTVTTTCKQVKIMVNLDNCSGAKIGFDKFSGTEWSVGYLDLGETTFADLNLSWTGRKLKEITALASSSTSQDSAQQTINVFSTKINTLISGDYDKYDTITITPTFELLSYTVTFVIGDGVKSETCELHFGDKYSSVGEDLWKNKTKIGHTFKGWKLNGDFLSDDDVIDENAIAIASEQGTITLTAEWEVNQYKVEVTAKHATVNGATERLEANGVYYGTEFKITIILEQGYDFGDKDALSKLGLLEYSFDEKDSKILYCTVKVEDKDVSIEVPVLSGTNKVTLSGANIDLTKTYAFKVVASDVEGEEDKEEQLYFIENDPSSFNMSTGDRIRIKASAKAGYKITNATVEGVDSITVIKESSGSQYIILIEGINQDVEVKFEMELLKNNVHIEIADTESVSLVSAQGINFLSTNNIRFEVKATQDLIVTIKFAHGYEFDKYELSENCEYSLTTTATTDDYVEVEMTISNIYADGTITILSKLSTYQVWLKSITYDANFNKSDAKDAQGGTVFFVDSPTTEMVTIEYKQSVKIGCTVKDNYNFAGWSVDGKTILSTDQEYIYVVENAVILYAIFSQTSYSVSLVSMNYYTIYSEYNDSDKLREEFNEANDLGGVFVDGEKEISDIKVSFGASKSLTYILPTGYRYYGYGYMVGETFTYVAYSDGSNKSKVEILIDTTIENFPKATNVKLCVVVTASSFEVSVSTAINVNGSIEQKSGVGATALVGEAGQSVNQYGYVDGTRVHYSSKNFVSGKLENAEQFKVIAYTGEAICLQVEAKRDGYKFLNIVVDDSLKVENINSDNGKIIYKISGFVGGQSYSISVLFKPVLNNIKLNFMSDETVVDGGIITCYIDPDNKNKVFSSGSDYSSITVSAYSDSEFVVYAYVKNGFLLDENNISFVDEAGMVDKDSVEFVALNPAEKGYIGRVKFIVSNIRKNASISLKVTPKTFTVNLIENGTVLATIKNVKYNQAIDLQEANAGNIKLYTERITYKMGKLIFNFVDEEYTFDGFFTYENGAGVRYINAFGEVTSVWMENGYDYDELNSKYVLSENATVDENGDITISLFIYWSYMKTRFTFEIVPKVITDLTAKDFVSGVDYTNSWYYESATNYIEVSYNTNIHLIAPEIDGYKFYRYVISQRDENGTKLADVVSYSSDLPWSTNEIDKISECTVRVEYFAYINIIQKGGSGTYVITQDTNEANAQLLIKDGYVDTEKMFTIKATPDNGYTFVRWNNITLGKSWWDSEWENVKIERTSTFVMNFQGKRYSMLLTQTVGAREELYDTTYGRILNATITSIDGNELDYQFATYEDGVFTSLLTMAYVTIGDTVKFGVSVEYGFAVLWNFDNFMLTEVTDDMYYFSVAITADMVGEDGNIRIYPIIQNEILVIYITRELDQSQILDNTYDDNNIDTIGKITYRGVETDFASCTYGEEINLYTTVSERYAISSVTIKNYGKEIDALETYTKDLKILLSTEYLEQNGIVGTLQLKITYTRLFWTNIDGKPDFSGNGSEKTPYRIRSEEDLAMLSKLVSEGAVDRYGNKYADCSYTLMSTLNLSDKFWTPIGTKENPFNGTFNFNGYKINGIFSIFENEKTSFDGTFGVLTTEAQIIDETPVWYVILAVAVGIALVVSVIAIVLLAKKRKKFLDVYSTK